MLFAVIMRFDSLREIEVAMTDEVGKQHHIGIEKVPKRSTLSDANARRPEKFSEEVYMPLESIVALYWLQWPGLYSCITLTCRLFSTSPMLISKSCLCK